MAFGFGGPELFIILIIVLIVFGVGRLTQVGSGLGRSIREFKQSVRQEQDEKSPTSKS